MAHIPTGLVVKVLVGHKTVGSPLLDLIGLFHGADGHRSAFHPTTIYSPKDVLPVQKRQDLQYMSRGGLWIAQRSGTGGRVLGLSRALQGRRLRPRKLVRVSHME